MAKFTYEVKDAGSARRIRLRGMLDDKVDLAKLIQAAAPVMIFDFEGLENINSYGTKTWIEFLRALGARRLIYEKCPAFLIGQINLIPQLSANVAEISSFFLPYNCESCAREANKLVTREDALAPGFIEGLNSRFTCESCNRKLTFYDDEEMYFDFLGERP